MSRSLAQLPRRVFLVLMLAGSALITAASLAYFDFETLPPFVIEKLPVRFESLWLASLRIHVATASLVFPLCLMLMTRRLQRHAAWHRWLGRVTGFLVLVTLVPSGVVLAFDAKGGTPVTLGFLLSAAIVAGFMVHGIVTARRRDFVLHRRAMRHVVAQMSVAVTSRALIIGLDLTGFDPDLAYVVALWGPVLASALVAELLSFRSVSAAQSLLERIRRETLPWLFCSVIALSSVPSLASADEPSPEGWARPRVEEGLVKPLANQENRRFSRSRPAPRERRVRVTQATVTPDKRGRAFVPFAVDVRFGGEWTENDIVGCVYRGSGELFVKRGDAYRPAAFLLGKNVEPVQGVCEAAPPPARS